jgi:hypothetical protein
LSGENLFVIGQSYGQQITIVTVDVDGVIKSTQSVAAPWLTADTRYGCYTFTEVKKIFLNVGAADTYCILKYLCTHASMSPDCYAFLPVLTW